MIQYLEPLIHQALRQLPGAELIVSNPNAEFAKRYGDPKKDYNNDPDYNNIDLGAARWIQMQWPIDELTVLVLRISDTRIHYHDHLGMYREIQWENPDLLEILTTLLSKKHANVLKKSLKQQIK